MKRVFGLPLDKVTYLTQIKYFPNIGRKKEFFWELKISHPTNRLFKYQRRFTPESCSQVTGKNDNKSFAIIIETALKCKYPPKNPLLNYEHFFTEEPLTKYHVPNDDNEGLESNEEFDFRMIESNEIPVFPQPKSDLGYLVLKITTEIPPRKKNRKGIKLVYWISIPPIAMTYKIMGDQTSEINAPIPSQPLHMKRLMNIVSQQGKIIEGLSIKDKKRDIMFQKVLEHMNEQEGIISEMGTKISYYEETLKNFQSNINNVQKSSETMSKKMRIMEDVVNEVGNECDKRNHERNEEVRTLQVTMEKLKKKLEEYFSKMAERKRMHMQRRAKTSGSLFLS